MTYGGRPFLSILDTTLGDQGRDIEEVQKGTKMPRIVELLNEHGLKTRTGRPWKHEILRNELRNIRSNLNAETPSRTGAE